MASARQEFWTVAKRRMQAELDDSARKLGSLEDPNTREYAELHASWSACVDAHNLADDLLGADWDRRDNRVPTLASQVTAFRDALAYESEAYVAPSVAHAYDRCTCYLLDMVLGMAKDEGIDIV